MKKFELVIDTSGRFVIPKKVRELCNITANEVFEVFVEGVRIILQPARQIGKLEEIDGVTVFSGEGSFSAEDALDLSRQQRDETLIQRLSFSKTHQPKTKSNKKTKKQSTQKKQKPSRG